MEYALTPPSSEIELASRIVRAPASKMSVRALSGGGWPSFYR